MGWAVRRASYVKRGKQEEGKRDGRETARKMMAGYLRGKQEEGKSGGKTKRKIRTR